MAEERELILKLGKKITDRIPYKLGMEKLTVNDPEYWGLAGVVTDEMAEVALCIDVYKRQPYSSRQILETDLRQTMHRSSQKRVR